MKFIQLLEKRFRKYAIRNLMKYIILLYGAGLLIYTFYPNAVLYLGLDIDKVLKGQVWRLATFLIPYVSLRNIFFVFLKAYIFYVIGNALENAWGYFRLNLYFFSAVIFNIIAAFIVYGIFRFNILGNNVIYNLNYSMLLISSPLEIIYSSMFFAFAALYPNTQFMIYFIIPVKVKYLAWISGAMYIYNIYNFIVSGFYLGIVPIVVSLANFLIFYFSTRVSPREFERKARFRKQMYEGKRQGNVTDFKGSIVITRHKCAVCGKSELDDDNLEFRFCSKCEGNYEYCMEHLFTHDHARKTD